MHNQENQMEALEEKDIASLDFKSACIALRVRVLRKRNSAFRPTETCFLLVDKQVQKSDLSYLYRLFQW